MTGRGRGRGLALALAIMATSGPASAVELAGWRAGAEAATMDKGQRFTCEGGDCPAGGLQCLYAVSPGEPGKGRTLRVHDMLRPKSFPWKDFEIWVAMKAGEIRPELANASSTLKANDAARLARLGERDFMRRSYTMNAAAAKETVEVGLWVTDNQLNAAICAVNAVDRPLAETRIDVFFGALNTSPPAPPYDPLAQQ
ncbi:MULTISPECIES: hypothetical protein [unclassified Aureimonas]|uniref:hypothetical protein n=1 Tax=unclassified Aureimonas TaxID=2615206 RepID=UPI0006F9B4BA|nr:MULTISPECIES: hypothetical protein [unclassified Aureimonas]KQT66148.1 hypothetical protein ASG62_20320 [Aureimonas sp. Leaf427]KQT80987.1 hypothetical protein ASG54_05930 [Aureimonas sp. Leaf460]